MDKSQLLKQIHESYQFQYLLSQVPAQAADTLAVVQMCGLGLLVSTILMIVSIYKDSQEGGGSPWIMGTLIGGFVGFFNLIGVLTNYSTYITLTTNANAYITNKILAGLLGQ